MKKIILLFVALCMPIIGVTGFAEASDGVIELRTFNMTTGYFDTPAELLVTDSQGRRTGYSSSAPFNRLEQINMFQEIPEGMYEQDGVGSASDEDPVGIDDSGLSNFRRLRLQEAAQGTYSVQIIGRKTGQYAFNGTFRKIDGSLQFLEEFQGFIVQGQTTTLNIDYNPTPGTPAPVIVRVITFDVLRSDLSVARQLNQLGDDKFARSLAKNIDSAEKLAGVCATRRHGKDKPCQPAIAVLKLFIKRLELANRKCDSKNQKACDEDNDWNDFSKEHRKDRDYDEFFKDWDQDDWHKYKKTCKRFVSDEALKIITEDAQWLIKSLGGKIDKQRDSQSGGKEKE